MNDQLPKCDIYNMDCLQGMGRIADHTVDCIICDLPYGTTVNDWDKTLSFDALWSHYKRLIKPNGAIILFSHMPFTAHVYDSNPDWFKYELIWVKSNSTGFLNAKFAPLKVHENILVFSEGGCFGNAKNHPESAMTYNPQMVQGKPYVSVRKSKGSENYNKFNPVTTVSDGKRYPNDVLYFKYDNEKYHPTQKPVDLLTWLILTYTNKGETVLDNCMGSGSTGVAAIRNGRNFIGFEIIDKYFNIAQKRIQEEIRNGKTNFD